MPVVFAVQNIRAAESLKLEFYFYIEGYSAPVSKDLRLANYSNASDPTFVYDYVPVSNKTERQWPFIWQWEAKNCSIMSKNSRDYVDVHTNGRGNRVNFTTEKGAKLPDLVAATQDGICDKSNNSYAINITSLLDAGRDYNDEKCPVLASTAPAPNPCQVKINPSQASSISYAIQSSACNGGWNPAVSCPPGVPLWNTAWGIVRLSIGKLVWLMVILCFFIHMM
ncbi:hypothetical protein PRK78_004470 [Emydomyces testavorans]|uniref:DUF7136 domain-containing protein n=1 Tax=Emydomyces testavorans TaxID=2070801 RepID=A0AAF0DJZ4_9EURO|nr:hypothetical protein PRK78_004470 [Emydomyces testavorans]